MKKSRDSKAITLIALIITIVVLLILSGVTISAINEGNLFAHANNAATAYQTEVQRESDTIARLLSMIPEEGGSSSGGNSGNNSSNNNNEGNNESLSYDELEKYILGADKTGREITDIMDTNAFTFLADPADSNSTVHENIKYGYVNMNSLSDAEIFVRYGKDVYKFTCDLVNTAKTSALTHTNTLTGHLGEYVTYGGIQYIVMAEDTTNGTVDLISADALQVNSSNISIGYNDSGAITAIPAVDENNPTEAEKGQRGIWSYNNAVETIVTACKNATGLTIDGSTVLSIRSVGNTNFKYTSTGITGSDAPGYITSADMANVDGYDATNNDWYSTYYDSYNIKNEDTNYTSDVNLMKQLGILVSDNREEYWLASRKLIRKTSERVDITVFDIHNLGVLDWTNMLSLYNHGYVPPINQDFMVRPIVTLSSSAISW